LITASQIKAGRALIDWSQGDLSEKSGLALATIKRMEKLGPGRSAMSNVEAVKTALETAGVMFIDANGNGAGVRLRGAGGGSSEGTGEHR
jgi:predicted transcriptional regulator